MHSIHQRVSLLVLTLLVSLMWTGFPGAQAYASGAGQEHRQLPPRAYLPLIIRHQEIGVDLHSLLVSQAANRSGPLKLQDRRLSGTVFVFLDTPVAVSQVRFYLDDPNRAGPPRQIEDTPPYDFAGGLPASANPFDTNTVPDGPHTITAAIYLAAGGTEVVSASFDVANCPRAGYDQVHLAWTGDAATTLTVVWRTCTTLAPSAVQYRPAGAAQWLTATGTLRPSGTDGTLHEVTLTGLASGVAYEYTVAGDGGTESPPFQTHTAPVPGGSFDFVYVADTGLVGRADGLASGTQQVINEIVQMGPLLILGGGDYAYFNTDTRYGTLEHSVDAWFNQMQPAASRSVLMPTYGNHELLLGESFPPWAARFPTPAGYDGQQNYSFDVGDVHFVSLLAVYDSGSNQGITAGQLQWLESDISAANAAGKRWVVPFYHVSPFSDGTVHPSNLILRGQLGPLFERLGVKLAISSHDQAYERSYPLVNVPATNTPTSSSLTCYTPADGVIWVKVSPGGKESNISGSFSPFGSATKPAWTAVRDNTMHHFARVTATASGDLLFQAIGVKGDGSAPVVQDNFRITKGTCP